MMKEYEKPMVEVIRLDLEEKISSESGKIENPFETSEGWGIPPIGL